MVTIIDSYTWYFKIVFFECPFHSNLDTPLNFSPYTPVGELVRNMFYLLEFSQFSQILISSGCRPTICTVKFKALNSESSQHFIAPFAYRYFQFPDILYISWFCIYCAIFPDILWYILTDWFCIKQLSIFYQSRGNSVRCLKLKPSKPPDIIKTLCPLQSLNVIQLFRFK